MGHNVIYDRLHLTSGDRWREKLKAAIGASHIFLLIWSKHARRSTPVLWEIECARARLQADPPAIQFMPVVLGRLKSAPIPAGLEHWHFPEPPTVWLH